jgi:hypothetical protein
MAARFARSSATAPSVVRRERQINFRWRSSDRASGLRLLGEFLDSAIDRLVEGVDLMLPYKLHESAASVGNAVGMEDVPREFLSIPLNDHGKELS